MMFVYFRIFTYIIMSITQFIIRPLQLDISHVGIAYVGALLVRIMSIFLSFHSVSNLFVYTYVISIICRYAEVFFFF